jgi:hypothetical protein
LAAPPTERPRGPAGESADPDAAGDVDPAHGAAAGDRLARIEREIAELRDQLQTLRDELGGG